MERMNESRFSFSDQIRISFVKPDYVEISIICSFAMYYKNRLWRTEVNAKKRERTRQQAAEMKEMQKFLLIKVSWTRPNISRVQLPTFRV